MIGLNNFLATEIRREIKVNTIRRLPNKYKISAIPRILPDYKCINIHIPKTGGTSVTSALNKLVNEPVRIHPRLRLHEHIKAREVKNLLGNKIWGEFFTFAFVRNPWDLMVSSYYWWLQKAYVHKKLSNYVEAIKQMENFTNFINSNYGREMINECKGNLFDWISENDVIVVDFVGRFENLQDDFNHICKNIGVKPIVLPHKNKTERQSYRNYYTEETKQLVAERFRKTIEMFDYEY